MARVVAFSAGLGVAGFGYNLFRTSLWEVRAKATDEEVRDLTREVPIDVSENPLPTPPVPALGDVVASVVSEDYTGAAVSAWNKGVMKLHDTLTSALTKKD